MKILFIVCCFCLAGLIHAEKWWVWKCNDGGLCKRLSKTESSLAEPMYPTLELCRLVCGNNGALWPSPTIASKIGTELVKFSPKRLSLSITTSLTDGSDADEYLRETTKYFNEIISIRNTDNCPDQNNATVNIDIVVKSGDVSLLWTTDESFTLEIIKDENRVKVKIFAENVFGARHGVETLTQLIEYYPDENDAAKTCLAIVSEAAIADKPQYPHRGLLIDTARNFQSVATIKKHLNAMASSKFNVLHWHITDSQSFPLQLPKLPNMTTFGAYSDDKIYTPDQVADIVKFAKYRGIRVLLEFDAPSHAGNGWQWGPDAGLGNLAVCINRPPYRDFCIQPPCGQLNPINSNVYAVLEKLFADMIAMAPNSGFFHMGGDEVYIPCWNQTEEIVSYMNGDTSMEAFLKLWSEFQEKASQAYFKAAGIMDDPLILWTSHLTDPGVIQKYLSKDKYVIQTWVPKADSLPTDLIKLGYRVIISTKDAWYLDHGFWGTTDYHDWRTVYNNVLPESTAALGGEVCMWGELVDDSCVESRVWPRAAAAAERLWSNPTTNSNKAQFRFLRHRERLVSRGIHAEALAPQWCYQNEGDC